MLYRIKTSARENRAWYIDGQDVILLARLLGEGRFPIERTIAVGGPMALDRKHFLTRAGFPLNLVKPEQTLEKSGVRYIVGGVLSGYACAGDSFMGYYEKALALLPEGGHRQFLGFARPRYTKPSRSRAFLSCFNPSILPYDCDRHGEERACVNCGFCADVCPVDILPQFAYKSILADEIEEALDHGMLDCVECGLCTYVCPSKIELARALKQTKTAYRLEQA